MCVCFCRSESQAFQRELARLSERYSHKCLELNRAEQSSAEKEREIGRKERDMEQLRKENQVSYQHQPIKSRTDGGAVFSGIERCHTVIDERTCSICYTHEQAAGLS